MSEGFQKAETISGIPMDKYYALEFAIGENASIHQFRIWNSESEPMCFLVKEDSAILKSLKVGDTLRSKYYTMDAVTPTKDLDTEIRQIKKEDNGRFKGHFSIGFAIK